MPNNYLSVLYKHIIQVENENVGLKVWGWGSTNIPLPPNQKSDPLAIPPPPPPPPVASYASVFSDLVTPCSFYQILIGNDDVIAILYG